MEFTARQEAFISEFLKCRNGAEAARRAGYSARAAKVQASRLLTNANLLAEIKRRTEENAMGEEEVLSRLADEARGTMEDFVSFNEGPYPTFTLDLDKARERGRLHLIKKLKYNSDGFPEIELLDPQTALVQIGKLLGMFVEKSDVTLHGEIAIKGYVTVTPDDWDEDKTDRNL